MKKLKQTPAIKKYVDFNSRHYTMLCSLVQAAIEDMVSKNKDEINLNLLGEKAFLMLEFKENINNNFLGKSGFRVTKRVDERTFEIDFFVDFNYNRCLDEPI
jgi:hypothetical protein